VGGVLIGDVQRGLGLGDGGLGNLPEVGVEVIDEPTAGTRRRVEAAAVDRAGELAVVEALAAAGLAAQQGAVAYLSGVEGVVAAAHGNAVVSKEVGAVVSAREGAGLESLEQIDFPFRLFQVSEDLRTALDLRRQQLKEFVERGTVNLKHSPGGIVDIEYAIQYLQIMHGHRLTILRTPNTMQALAALVDCGLVPRQDGEDLRKAYFFIRMLIDGLRMVRGNAKDRVLPSIDSDEFIFLARRVGYTTDDWQAGAKHLKSDIEEHMGKVKEFFEKTFGKV